ncbi:MAG TPA: hypothetical protein PK629_08205 [Oscillospiraceae bacterium]|nr:hypothetical protein [Oscillospiraceae bacterium]HPF55820.1 hypothetical protein [Clostridiales bacterium]HPK35441.1 hypothetical protein [Oscillospiraceae bacterium]HPR75165.1 hypothetical protein [Oscillospiraceae bacterium]
MRKALSLFVLLALALCSCSTKKPILSEDSPTSFPSENISAESSVIVFTASEPASPKSSFGSAASKTYYEDYYVTLINEIPADNGDEISYVEAIKIGDRIFSGSKNKLISFKEDWSDFQVLYEYPDTDFYFGGLIQFDENIICARFADQSWGYEALGPFYYEYLLIDLTDQSVTPYSSEREDHFYPFKGLGDDYYINLKEIDDVLYPSFKRDLYKVNPNGEDELLMTDIGLFSIHKTGIYIINYPEINNNNYSTVYFFDFETQKLNRVMEMRNLKAFTVSGDYILYSAGAYTHVYLYDIVNKTTVFLNNKLGFEFSVGSSAVRDEHFFVDYIYDQNMSYAIMDINMDDFKITEADKTNLPGYIGGWQYYIVIPPYADTDEDVPEEFYYTLWRHDWNYEKQFVY